jgi:hypothetical protein
MARLQVLDEGTTSKMEDSCVRIAEKRRSTSLGFGRVINNSSPYKIALLRKRCICFRLRLNLWYDPNDVKGIKLDKWNVRRLYMSGYLTASSRE